MRTKDGVQDAALQALQSDLVDIPDLIEIQMDSFRRFLEEGIRDLFNNFSPIEDFTGNLKLELVDYHLEEPKYSQEECRQRDMTYEAPMKVLVRLSGAGREVLESEVFLGTLPIITERGTFIINGAERVVVSQLARSPGVYFNDNIDLSGRTLYIVRVIPNEGAWTEIETEANDAITVRIGQTKKFPITTLLRALNFDPAACPTYSVPPAKLLLKRITEPLVDLSTGEVLLDKDTFVSKEVFDQSIAPHLETPGVLPKAIGALTPCTTDQEIVDLFSTREMLRNEDGEGNSLGKLTRDLLLDKRPAEDVVDDKGKVLCKAYARINREEARKIEGLGLEELPIRKVHRYIEATLEMDPTHGESDALLDIYRKVRPGDPATQDSARQMLGNMYYDLRRYDLARVGRYKINKKLGIDVPLTRRSLSREDLVSIIRYIIRLNEEEEDLKSLPYLPIQTRGTTDDIDHLENKRVRSVGELLQNQLRMGFLRMEKVAKERMTSMDPENASPQVVLSIKPISASVKSFFGSSQLCQFMDQHNPLAELTHKRRLSALGPGGLSRQSAKLEVRDVHHSHYGRICPIETPEGPNIGLIGSMALFTKIDQYGFLRAPYRVVKDGVVGSEVRYVTADEEETAHIAPASTLVDAKGKVIPDTVQVRYGSGFPEIPRNQIQYIDRSPMQIFSAAASLIPFLENDDANRALMGSNMQRQAVPLLRAEAPLVATGVERKVAEDSGAVVVAHHDGVVTRVTAEEILVRRRDGGEDRYHLQNMLRSNQATCITEKPIVYKGQRVRAGQPLADGPCTDQGKLALGQNILAAFMTWEGYNYEDAIILSQRIVKDDVYTSIHIEKYEVEARDTKLGPEEITRDIPNVGEDALKDLDENGIIRIGAEVQAEDILVGKIAPKSQGEQSAEERLIIAIFGKKAEEASDVSLRVPHGGKGKVVDVKVFSRFKFSCSHCKAKYDFSKKPDKTTCDRCGSELIREPSDELAAGVNMLCRVYVAQKRKIMEGDKMAGRHGNKGVVSRILPESELPFMPDGTPVDIVLNPLGVPSRMNIGQVLETHLGLVGRALGISFTEPIFNGRKEPQVLSEMERMADQFRRRRLREYLCDEILRQPGESEDPKSPVGVEEVTDPVTGELLLTRDDNTLNGDEVAAVIRRVLEGLQKTDADTYARITQQLGLGITLAPMKPAFSPANGTAATVRLLPESDGEAKEVPASVDDVLECIEDNVWRRIGLERRTDHNLSGKCTLISGRSGEPFDGPVTVGYIYMLKLLHLVEDKIHARSTGPYALVTQQPLGGKAQFG
ncbi:MAG TPA: DNA-directed RNA polymerase subunit beta, partial [Armatimonadota bacterium]